MLQALLASVLTLSLSTGIKTSVDKHKGKGRFDTSILGQLILENWWRAIGSLWRKEEEALLVTVGLLQGLRMTL